MLRILPLALLLSLAAATPANAAASVSGLWLTTEKDSVIEIGPCGGGLCGRIARILKPNPNGPPRDINNPDPALRNRPIQGLPILTGFRDAGSNWEGTAYDPRAGKSYRSYLTVMRDGTLEVKGCVAFFCRTNSWTPVR
mgnify:CR=1 FL=1